MTSADFTASLTRAMQELTEQGRIIEAGWISMRIACVPADAPPHQVEAMRNAFMGGAVHLFSAIMTILDPGDEITADDERRMELISNELAAYSATLVAETLETRGRA